MSFADQTLHDFVLNLLTNDAARSAFGADPAAALSGAGLHDVTPQDVQEVVPLVLDYAPAGIAMPALPALPALPGGVQADSVIQQLQAVAQAGGTASALPHLDAARVGSLGGGLHGASEFARYTAGGEASAHGVVGGAAVAGEGIAAQTTFAAGTDGFGGGFSAATPAGSFDFQTTGVPAVGLPDVALPGTPALPRLDSLTDHGLSLDTGALTDNVSAGTVAGFVTAGGDAFAAAATTGSATLGGYLTGAGAGPAGDAVLSGAHTVTNTVSDTTHSLGGQLAGVHVPAVGALPSIPGALPAHGLPTDLPSHLPDLSHLPVNVPAELPHLPVANPLPHVALPQLPVHTPLDSAVSHSPLGDVTTPDHGALLHPADAPIDLHLGH